MTAAKPKATYDPEADAIGIYFAPEGARYVESEEVAPAWSSISTRMAR